MVDRLPNRLPPANRFDVTSGPKSRRVSVGALNALVIFGFRFATPRYKHLVGPLYRRFALERRTVEPNDGNVFTPSSPDQR